MIKLLLTLCLLALAGSAQAFRGDPFEDMFRTMDAMMGQSMPSIRQNLEETDAALIIKIAAPGMKEDDFKIEVLQDTLKVSAEQKDESRNTVSTSSFVQSFGLPMPVKAGETVASYDAGILTITMPKQEQVKPRTIEVKVTRSLKKTN